mmetsp:Transcript_21457/g.32613  ORF Transcript_21457/g.32613 Transcript_21457/m.32613 type:complete len:321 (-) Transcript_21457:126-1088(-)
MLSPSLITQLTGAHLNLAHPFARLKPLTQLNGNGSSMTEEEMMAMTKHTLLSVAASIMCVPAEVFTTPPMVDPYPPSNATERDRRKVISNLLSSGWDPTDGFQISSDEVEAIDGQRRSNETASPSTYGEITELGARQLFKYMQLIPVVKPTLEKVSDFKKEQGLFSFADLGSGNGRLLIQSYMEMPSLQRIIGIELSNLRHCVAVDAWGQLQDAARSIRLNSDSNAPDIDIEMNEGDLFLLDISSLTHIYVASLCFSDDMIHRLANKLVSEADALKCVATLKPFPIEFNESLGEPIKQFIEMTWTKKRGTGCTVYFYHIF